MQDDGAIISKMRSELVENDQRVRTLSAVCALQAKALGVVDKILRTSNGCFCNEEPHNRGCVFLSQVIKEAKASGMKSEADRKIQLA